MYRLRVLTPGRETRWAPDTYTLKEAADYIREHAWEGAWTLIAEQYVWSRFAPNAVEHIATGKAPQPICGTWLDPERLVLRDRPSGLAKLCARCQAKITRKES